MRRIGASSTLAAPAPVLGDAVDDLADEVASALRPLLTPLARDAADTAYDQATARFSADKERLADEIIETARPKVRALVKELLDDPALAAKVGDAKAELRAGFERSVWTTALLSIIGTGVVVYVLTRK